MSVGSTPSSGPALRLARLDLGRAIDDPSVAARRRALVERGAVPDPAVRDGARAILRDVRERGDPAVRSANERFGGGRADGALTLEREALVAARDALSRPVRAALDQAIANVRRFAEAQRPATTITTIEPGVELERRWVPLVRLGAYVPGGTAPYPSSLVMTVAPASVAGVGSVVVASPAGADGTVDPVLAGAAGLLEVDAFVVSGGAQAIGAMAYGLPAAGLEPVDRIVGPGNAWVTAAKLEAYGDVGIDLPAGPSEGMVLADSLADPRVVAADLITQAEHGPDSPALLVSTDPGLIDAVEAEVGRQLAVLPRRAILERALARHGVLVLAPDAASAIDFVNDYGPEHLSIEMADLEATVARIRNAGSVFVGPWAPESAGDYVSGANHVLPTGGLARSCGALDMSAYGKFVQVQRIDRGGLLRLREAIGTLATAEGLLAHRAAVEIRFAADRDAAPRADAPTDAGGDR